MERTRKPTSPGEIIQAHYLEPLGITITDLAASLGLSRKTLSAIVNGHGTVTVDIAMRLSRALSTSPEMWLNLQMALDLWNARQIPGKWKEIEPLATAGE